MEFLEAVEDREYHDCQDERPSHILRSLAREFVDVIEGAFQMPEHNGFNHQEDGYVD
jgi:hypothetical protein